MNTKFILPAAIGLGVYLWWSKKAKANPAKNELVGQPDQYKPVSAPNVQTDDGIMNFPGDVFEKDESGKYQYIGQADEQVAMNPSKMVSRTMTTRTTPADFERQSREAISKGGGFLT